MVRSLQNNKSIILQPIHKNVTVNVQYNVYFTSGLFNFKNPLLAQFIGGEDSVQPKQVLAIVDEELLRSRCRILWQLSHYSELYSNKFTFICEPLVVPKEEVKSYIHWREQIHKLIEPVKLDQECYLLAIGGQNVLNLADYLVANTYRQINLIRVPSTLMAPNYLGIGENQTSHSIKKANNFTPPYTVFNDFAFIKNLDEYDWRSSILEAIRVALMLDADFFEFLRENTSALVARDMDSMQQAVHRYAKLCITHFSTNSNPFIIKSFNPFDFGDWSIPKLEKLTQNRLHSSEALAIGIALDSTYSYLIGMLSRLEWQKILKILVTLSFDLYVPELAQQADKLKNRSQSQILSIVGNREDGLSLKLPQCIGKGTEVYEVNLPLYRQAIIMLQEFVENNPKPITTSTTRKNFKHQLYESKSSNIQPVAVGYNVG